MPSLSNYYQFGKPKIAFINMIVYGTLAHFLVFSCRQRSLTELLLLIFQIFQKYLIHNFLFTLFYFQYSPIYDFNCSSLHSSNLSVIWVDFIRPFIVLFHQIIRAYPSQILVYQFNHYLAQKYWPCRFKKKLLGCFSIFYHNNNINCLAYIMKNIASIRYNKAAGRQMLYFGDSNADFYVLYKQKLYPLRKNFITSSAYLWKKVEKNHRVHVIQANFKTSVFEKLLGCFYGMKCIYERGKETDQLMEVIKFIECKDLEELVRSQIIKNFSQYQIFFLLDFASKYNDYQLQNRCEKELIKFNFEQFNFSRFELLNVKEETFVSLIKLHQRLKRDGAITGLPFQKLRKIISEYNAKNSTSIDLLTVFKPPNTLIILEDPEQEKVSPLIQSSSAKYRKGRFINLKNSDSEQSSETKASENENTIQDLTQSCVLGNRIETRRISRAKSKQIPRQQIQKVKQNERKKKEQKQWQQVQQRAWSQQSQRDQTKNESIEQKQESLFRKKNESKLINLSQSLRLPLVGIPDALHKMSKVAQDKQRLSKSHKIENIKN